MASRFQNHGCRCMGQGETSESGMGTESAGRDGDVQEVLGPLNPKL